MGGEFCPAEMQADVSKKHVELQSAFDTFQSWWKKNWQKVAARPKRQASLTDMVSWASSSK